MKFIVNESAWIPLITSEPKKRAVPVNCMTWGQLHLLTVQMINPSGDFGGDRIIPYNFTQTVRPR